MTRVTFFSEGPLIYYTPTGEGQNGAHLPTEVGAADYLSFAKDDICSGTKQGAINALGNAKRALHLMIDTVLQSHGLLRHSLRASFPEKLETLDRVGLISLSVFRRLNIERNVAEHEYTVPAVDRVQEFIDVCDLLQLATDQIIGRVPYSGIVGIRDTREHVLLVLEPLLGRLDFYPIASPDLRTSEAFGSRISWAWPSRRPGGEVLEGGVDSTPIRSIELRQSLAGEWQPYLESLFDMENPRNVQGANERDGFVQVSLGYSFRVSDVSEKSLAVLMGIVPTGA